MWGLLIMTKLFNNFDAPVAWAIIAVVAIITLAFKLKGRDE